MQVFVFVLEHVTLQFRILHHSLTVSGSGIVLSS